MAVLVDTQLEKLCEGKRPVIKLDEGLSAKKFIQPASMDLPLKPRFYSVAAEPDLSGGRTIKDFFLKNYRQNTYEINSNNEAVAALIPGTLYLFEVAAKLNLPATLSATANPKSSTGRNFLHCKVITENGGVFDAIPAGYQGPLYVLATPRQYPIRWAPSETLVQLRFRTGSLEYLTNWELSLLHRETPLISSGTPIFEENGLKLHLNLQGELPIAVAHRMGRTLDLRDRNKHRPHLYFWDKPHDGQGIIHLEPNDAALAYTTEQVRIPTNVCSEMGAIDPRHGEVRWHDAGFIDPGFGLDTTGKKDGWDIVCEISNFGPSPVQLAHGREIGLLKFEWLDREPAKPYGSANNNYAGQRGIRFAKQFLPWSQTHSKR